MAREELENGLELAACLLSLLPNGGAVGVYGEEDDGWGWGGHVDHGLQRGVTGECVERRFGRWLATLDFKNKIEC